MPTWHKINWRKKRKNRSRELMGLAVEWWRRAGGGGLFARCSTSHMPGLGDPGGVRPAKIYRVTLSLPCVSQTQAAGFGDQLPPRWSAAARVCHPFIRD